jgi:Zn-dependent protease with chaperone function
MAIKKFNQYGLEKILKIQHTGSNIRVTKDNFPEILATLEAVCEILYLKEIPELYLMWSYEIHSITYGVEKPIIVISSACIDKLTHDELLFILGHEVGHIKSQHVLYHQMAKILPYIGSIIGKATLGFGELLSYGLQLALYHWREMSEFTADRAGLLATQNVKSTTSAIMKLAGLPEKYFNKVPIQTFIDQAREFEEYDYNSIDKAAKIISNLEDDQPWTVIRASEFIKWISSGRYESVLKRESLEKLLLEKNKSVFCPECGEKVATTDTFCGGCGNNLAN